MKSNNCCICYPLTLTLRHIWSEIHGDFFSELDQHGLRASSYSHLTLALQKVSLPLL